MTETIAPASGNGTTADNGDTVEIPVKKFERGTPKEILNNAFMLGWKIVELKSRIQIAPVHSADFGITQSSIWRSIVNKIAMMQAIAFPDCSTAETLYEPPPREGLPYLYPPAPDFANIGIPEKDSEGNPVLENFKLYEVTRRAINCLTLLYIKEQESLIPDVIKLNQTKLVRLILDAAKNTGKGGGDVSPEGDLSERPNVIMDMEPPADATQFEKDRIMAIEVLTKRTVKFLDAWDGYLRENYYAGGMIPRDDTELIAYESGRSMSLLPWSISVLTVPLVEQATHGDSLTSPFITAWRDVFRSQAIVRLQHQISSLSSSLDDCYYTKHPEVKRQDDDEKVLVMPNADLPSQSVMAVKQSLDFWHRTVDWISQLEDESQLRKKDERGIPAWSEPMRLALIEQANIWQTLITGQQHLRAYNMESITKKLMEDVTRDIQKNLNTDFKGSFKKAEAAMNEMAGEVKNAVANAGKTAVNGLGEMYKSFKKVIWLVIGIILLIFVLLLILPSSLAAIKQYSGGVGLSGIISAVLGFFGLNRLQDVKQKKEAVIIKEHEDVKSKVDTQTTQGNAANASPQDTGFLSRIQGAAQETGKIVIEAFDRGYKQIRIELSGLSHSAAVSYPLIEFFGSTFKLESDDDFLTKIIWNGTQRTDQLKRVMSAAFGPIAVFITPSEHPDDEEKKDKISTGNKLTAS